MGGASMCKCSRLALIGGAEGSRRKAGRAGRERQKAEGRALGSAHSGALSNVEVLVIVWVHHGSSVFQNS